MKSTRGKPKHLHFAAVWLCMFTAVISSVFVFAPPAEAASSDVPTLFYNDTAWVLDAYYPSLGFVTGATEDFWIPLCFFEEIDNIRVRRGPSKNVTSFVISDSETGKYLSFDITNNDYAQTERGTYQFIHTTLYSKERYLPMRDLCAYFGWSFEMSEDRASVRITDGGQVLEFADLLAIYDPSVITRDQVTERPPAVVTTPSPETLPPTVVTTTEEPDTTAEPVTTDPPVTEVKYRSPVVYLTFEDIDDVYTPQLLDLLAEYEVQATFFVTGMQLSEYTSVVTRLLSEGHSIGLHSMTGNERDIINTETLLAAFADENELLYALTKRKTRLIRLPEGSHSGLLYLTENQKKTLADEGYVLWDWNIAAMDVNEAYTVDMILEKIQNALKTSYYPVIRFHCTNNAVEVMTQLLAHFVETQSITPAVITEATIPVVFP